MKPILVTKYVRNNDWSEHYSKHINYALLRRVQGGVITGFMILQDPDKSLPMDCEEATLDDAILIREHRKQVNLLPTI